MLAVMESEGYKLKLALLFTEYSEVDTTRSRVLCEDFMRLDAKEIVIAKVPLF